MRRVLTLAVFSLFPALAFAAPPDVPAKLTAKVGAPVLFDVKPDGAKPFMFAPGFDKSLCPIVRLYSDDPKVASFMVIPQAAGEYYVTFWTRGEEESKYVQLVITVTRDGVAPPPKPPAPPVDPPVPVPVAYYFLIVRVDGPASPAFTAAMSLPEWSGLARAGHNYKDKTLTDAVAIGVRIPAGTTLPAVVILRPRPDGKSDQLGIVPFPTTGDGITALPGLVK